MRKMLLTGAAACALSSVAAVVPAVAADPAWASPAPGFASGPAFSWSGFYLGANAGAVWGRHAYDPLVVGLTLFDGFTAESDGAAFLGGVQAGYNWQLDRFVLGVEGDLQGTALEAAVAVQGLPGAPAGGALFDHFTAETNWTGSLRARAGVTVDRFLLYATGGLAVADVDVTADYAGTLAFGRLLFTDNRAHVGWTLGAGVEAAVTSHLSLGLEYRYADFRGEPYFLGTLPGTVTAVTADVDLQTHQVIGKVNYRLNLP